MHPGCPLPPPPPTPPPPAVLDLLMYVFGDQAGHLDPVLFIDIMKRRIRVPGTRVRRDVPGGAQLHGGGERGGGCGSAPS
jgi:hypothetical protein